MSEDRAAVGRGRQDPPRHDKYERLVEAARQLQPDQDGCCPSLR